MTIQQLKDLEDSGTVGTKKRVNNIIAILGCIIILEFLTIMCFITLPPKTIIEEKEVIVEKEIYIEIEKEVPIEVEVQPTYVYNVTSEEREMLARLVFLEANIENLECQKGVVSVVLNRWKNGYWGDTLKDVVYAKNQFSPAHLIYKTTPNATNYEAVDYVLKNGCTLPDYVLYFRAAYHFSWYGYKPYTHIDQTYFGYMEKDKK